MSTSRRLLVGALLLASTGSVAACGPSDLGASAAAAPGSATTSSTGLGVVVGAHANAPRPKLSPELLGLVDAAVTDASSVVVVSNEGEPTVVASGSLAVEAENDLALARLRGEQRDQLSAAVSAVEAGTPENNLLGAIELAARDIASADERRTLAVVDSGLQTVAPLEFQADGLLQSDPAEVADFLEASRSLPDLTGYEVHLNGIGDVAEPQQPLSSSEQKNLRAIWVAVLERAGATVEVDVKPVVGDPVAPAPDVTTVESAPPPAVAVPPVAPAQVVSVELTQDAVAFAPSSPEYLDASAVDAVLAPIAADITAQGLAVHLTGTTASAGSAEGRASLSAERAERVKASLVALGAPAESITTEGVGSDWPGFVEDRDTAGNLVPSLAVQNRKVIVELSKT